MNQIKQILTNTQSILGNISALKYVDKNWGQLNYEVPAVKFPCALLDIDNVEYEQLLKGKQIAELDITITVANLRLTPGSLKSPRKDDSYAMIDILEDIHTAIQLSTNPASNSSATYAPLLRTNLRKAEADSSSEVYILTYHTSCQVDLVNPTHSTPYTPNIITS